MIKDSISSRYASALFELAKEHHAVSDAARDLQELGDIIRREPQLSALLANPGVEVEDKLGVLERLLQGSWSGNTRAFVHVVLTMGRAEFLAQMAEAFEELVDLDRHILRAQVRTARPLPEPMRKKLRAYLQQRERRTVELVEETHPELIGGFQVILENRILDGSVKTELSDLRRRLKSVRVH